MNCPEARERLPLLVYGDLAGDERARINSHLDQCDDCRAELAALTGVRRLLQCPGHANVEVDIAGVYAAESRRQQRVARRWQFVAFAGIAAGIALLAMRLEARIDDRQLIVRWGRIEPIAAAPAPRQTVVHSQIVMSAEDREQLNVLNELVRALAANMESNERGRQEELTKMRQQIAAIQQTYQKRWNETERDVSALYTAQFGARNPGANP